MPSPIPPLPLGLLGLAKEIGQAVPGIAPDAQRTGAEALAIMSDLFGHMFPHVSTPSRS